MAKTKAQAQALAQKTTAISSTESYQLVHCLVRVSVYHVCWMRGLFPEESFSGHDLSQLDKMHIKLLKPSDEDEEASTLVNWVEQGVMDAVQRGYLKNMYFGISRDAAATNLLEEYIYSFNYGENGVEVELDTTRSKHKDKNSTDKKRAPPNVDVVRYQVVRLMRMLVQVCQTLDEVPQERYLFTKLTYHDNTPEDYEPPHFHGVKEDSIGHFSRRPFAMEVGGMDTHHHTVSVRVKSVLDSCGDKEGGDEDMQELEGSQQMSGMDDEDMMADGDDGEAAGGAAQEDPAAASDQHLQLGVAAAHDPKLHTEEALRMLLATEVQDDAMMMDDHDAMTPGGHHNGSGSGHMIEPTLAPPASLAAAAAANTGAGGAGAAAGAGVAGAAVADSAADDETQATGEGGDGGDGDGGGDGGEELQQRSTQEPGASGQAYERVRSYCLARERVSYVDVLTCFYDLPGSQLGLVFDGLSREGLLQAGPDKDTFIVVQPGQAAPDSPAAAAAPGAQTPSGCQDPSQDPSGLGEPSQDPMVDAMVDAEEAAGDTSQELQDQAGPDGQAGAGSSRGRQQQEHHISQMMTGLSMGGGSRAAGGEAAGAGAAAAAAAKGDGRGTNASVLGRNMRAGSDVSGLPAQPTTRQAPSAAANQVDAAAADEPSVGLPQDQEQQHIWFDASQHSHRGPQQGVPGAAAAGAAAGGNIGNQLQQGVAAGAAAEAAAADGRPSRLRKASYVDKPIYQHTGKQRGGGGSSRRKGPGEGELLAAAVHQTANKVVKKPTKPTKPSGGHKGAAATGRGSRLAGMK